MKKLFFLYIQTGEFERLTKNFNWQVQTPCGSYNFITPDNPLINIKYVNKYKLTGPFNKNDTALEIGIVISPRFMITLRDDTYPFLSNEYKLSRRMTEKDFDYYLKYLLITSQRKNFLPSKNDLKAIFFLM